MHDTFHDLPAGPPEPAWQAALAAVDQPIGSASGLPNAAYTSAGFAAIERDELLAKTWTCIGRAGDVPAAGDAVPADLVGLPLMIVRGRDDAVRVFHNVCSHRGHRLVAQPCRSLTALRCPYHSWAYDLEGHLRATPHIGGVKRHRVDGFDKRQHGLKAVRSAVWLDLVFVNLSGDAVDFDDHVAALAGRWAAFDFTLLRHGGPDSRLRFDLNCNWKLAVENYCEAYHLPWIHPNLNSYSRLDDHYNILEEGGGESGAFAGQGSTVYQPIRPNDGPPLPRFPNLPDRWEGGAEYIALFPNVLLGVHCDHFYSVRLEPLAPDRTIEHFEIYYVGEAPRRPDYATLRRNVAANWQEIFAEDVSVVEEMQRGRASPAFQGGVFTPVLETPTHAFHRWVARGLGSAPSA